MDNIQIFVRVKDSEELEKITLSSIQYPDVRNSDFLWESAGEYYLEAFQCGSNPSVCSIEKDPRILNSKEELGLLILDELQKIYKTSIS